MKIFKNKKEKIIRVQLQKYREKPIYISFHETNLNECHDELKNYLINYIECNLKYSEIVKKSNSTVSICFIDVLTKERISFKLIGLTIKEVYDVIIKKYE